MEIQLISEQLIKPSLPTPTHLQTLPISFLDQRLTSRTVPFIFYYPNLENHPLNSTQHTKKLNHLKQSLSNTLTLFYPFAGRYIKENFTIACNDKGVSYSEALVNLQLSYFLEGKFQINELSHLVPDDKLVLEESDTSPLFGIQINIFTCGGLAIGIVHSHRIVDGFTFSLFVNHWAKACKNTWYLKREHLTNLPCFELGLIFPSRETIEVKLPTFSNSQSQVVTERFVFKPNEKTMSTSMVIAILWRALIKASRARHGVPRPSLLTIAVNLRGRTRKRTPENCCGNFTTYATVKFEVEDHEKDMGLDVFVEKVRDAIKRKVLEVGEEEEVYELVMRPTREIVEEGGEGDVHRFSSVRGFGLYGVDFGFGKPGWMSFANRVNKGVLIMDSEDGKGAEAWVTMDKEEMDCLRNDSHVFLGFGEFGYVKMNSCL